MTLIRLILLELIFSSATPRDRSLSKGSMLNTFTTSGNLENLGCVKKPGENPHEH